MKKTFKFLTVAMITLLVTVLVALGGTAQKASAGPAPKLTQFQIVGLSNRGYYGSNKNYIPKEYISEKSRFKQSSIYIFTSQLGYGNISYSIDGGSYQRGYGIDKIPFTGTGNIVYGWASVEEISNLTPGTHTITAMCDSTVGSNRLYDTITFTVY